LKFKIRLLLSLNIMAIPGVPLQIGKLFLLIDFSAVFFGAVGGALALTSALGGGITRDIILQHGPPLAFSDVRYLLLALAGALTGMVFASRIGKGVERLIVGIDAAGLGLFAVAGCTRALDANLGFLPALLLGCVTAVGGGSLRDVLSGRTPKVFERGELYAIAAAFGAAAFLVCDKLGLDRSIATPVGALCGSGLRILSLRFKWTTRSVRAE
jgi:uncharacterized membrane protein YeiH